MSYIVPREKPKCYNCPFRTLDYCGLLIEHDCVTVNVNEMTVSEYCPLVEIMDKPRDSNGRFSKRKERHMPRFNVQHPVTKEWRCFSTIVDDYVTDWMDEERYQKWREYEYGKQAGEIRDANQMSFEQAEEKIANRKRWEEGREE